MDTADREVVAVPFALVELAADVVDEVEDFEVDAEVGVVEALAAAAAAATVSATGAFVTGALAVGTSRSATVVAVDGFGLIVETGAVAAWAPPASATIKPLEHNVTRVAAGATARRRCAPECFEDFMNLVSTHRKPRLSLLPFQFRPFA